MESDVRGQEEGVRDQESGVRRQESGVWSQKVLAAGTLWVACDALGVIRSQLLWQTQL